MDGLPGIHKRRAVEDILARMMNGNDEFRSTIPCNYIFGKKQEKKIARQSIPLANLATRYFFKNSCHRDSP